MRKELNLEKEVLDLLQVKADKKRWSLKKYMEVVLINHVTKNNGTSKNNIKHNATDTR